MLRVVELDGEGVIVFYLQALELLYALLEALDVAEEGSVELIVCHCVVPRVNEVLCGNRGTIREVGLLELDGELGVVLVRLDGFCDLVLRLAICVLVHEARVDAVNDAAAAGFVGVCRDQRVLGFAAPCGDVVAAGTVRGAVIATACREGQS